MTNDSVPALQNSHDDIDVIVVALDTSNGASRVASFAARTARAYPAANVHMLHVFRASRFDRAHAGAPTASEDALHDAKDHLEYHVRAVRSQCRNQVIGHFLVGDPATEVLRSCKELKADLLVIGTHDYRGFERFLLGSIAESLMRKAPCSVLVVRPAQAP